MIGVAKRNHPFSKIISKSRLMDLLKSSVNTGNPVFGFIVYSSDFTDAATITSDHIIVEPYVDHERMTTCTCTGGCLHGHGDSCDNALVYERLVYIILDLIILVLIMLLV